MGTSCDVKCCIAIHPSHSGRRAPSQIEIPMSRQLTISSLTSAFALVCLCLFARAGSYGEVQLADTGPLVVVQDAGAPAN